MNMTIDKVLEQVKKFAAFAHGQQTRKYKPEPYVEHLVRVMETCRLYSNDVALLSAALLHDVLEDTATSKQALFDFLLTVMKRETAERTIHLVTELTDVYTNAAYPHWNRRKRKEKELERFEKTSRDAQTIKYADILDNSREIVSHDRGFAKKYLDECLEILKTARVETGCYGKKQIQW